MNKRKPVDKARIRSHWQSNIKEAMAMGFCEQVIENIADDSQKLSLCWCCGLIGAQERCHVVPYSLGGACSEDNMFLLCKECHTSSPDIDQFEYFVEWVNDNSCTSWADFYDMLNRFSDGATRFKPDQIDEMLITFSKSMKNALQKSSMHGTHFSRATRIATIVRALNQSAIDVSGYRIV